MNDTTPEIERMVRELMSMRTGLDRMKMAAQMFDAARTLVVSSFPSGLSSFEVKDRLCDRFYRGEVNTAAFSSALRCRQKSQG